MSVVWITVIASPGPAVMLCAFKRPRFIALLLFSLALSSLGCEQPRSQPDEPAADLQRVATDVDGNDITWPPPGDAGPTVFLFISRTCPIANGYAPEIGRLAERYAGQGVTFCLVYPEPGVTAEQVRTHAADYALPGTLIPDPAQKLTRAAEATITPEAVVVLPSGTVAYRGRINDRYADLGVRRPNVRSHDLRDALDAILAGGLPQVARTEPVGCIIEAPLPGTTP